MSVVITRHLNSQSQTELTLTRYAVFGAGHLLHTVYPLMGPNNRLVVNPKCAPAQPSIILPPGADAEYEMTEFGIQHASSQCHGGVSVAWRPYGRGDPVSNRHSSGI